MRLPNQDRPTDPPIPHTDADGAPQVRNVIARVALELGLERFGARTRTRERSRQAPCGHTRHIGTCPSCQRMQLARWQHQLAHANDAAQTSANEART